ncbi:MAG: RNA-directed DNA polymerase, partial [Muribaculaceae bacterium]|nr:RNA-directed DNA polymerase [Muribaculaceae bacterium]
MAAHKAFKGKSQTPEVLKFRRNFMDSIIRLRQEIIYGEVEIGNYNQFIIFEPKQRLICAAPLRQRIMHHAIMNVCHCIFDRQLIYDSYASRPLKGTHRAIQRVREKSVGYRYFVKLDIRKFFDSIDHGVLKSLLRRILKDKKLLQLLDQIIDSYGCERGLPIGNLTSQYFANYYLSPLDHYMKEDIKAPVYVRYMDDVIMMAQDKRHLMFL